jgi:hypothetical protein
MPITKKSAPKSTPKTTNKSTSSTASLSDLKEASRELSGRRKVLFTLEAYKTATKGKYGKSVLIAEDKLPVTFHPLNDLHLFTVEGKYYTIADGYYANSKGSIWPEEEA